jgi:hypothetical protein
MNKISQNFINLLKKFPYGEKFIEHSGKFVGGSYLIWVALVLIAIYGVARGKKFRQIRTGAGCLLLLVLSVLILLFLFKLFTQYR